MAPPGRRRAMGPVTLLFLLFWIFSSTASAASAVLGVDVGTEYLKAALVKPGIPLEIVLTKDSKRKESSAVALKPLKNAPVGSFPERLYGSDAVALAARFASDVYPNLKPLLGVTTKDWAELIEEYKGRYPALQLSTDKSRGTVAFTSTSFKKDKEPFLVEELLAMELQNLKANAEALAGKGTTIKEAVITVPAFYTAQEKRAVELAADLAGMRVLGLISDGLAVGLNYATSRTFKPASEGGAPEHHLVFDMGAGSTTASLVKFQGRTVKDVGRFNKTIQEAKVLGTGWDRTLGGDALNSVLVNDMVEQFVASSKATSAGVTADAVKSHGRTAAKLWKEAERIRQVLSANSDTMASFEGLYDDIDFRYKITRSHFEQLTTSFAKRVEAPLSQAVSAADLDLSKIDSIILHGGASRTPFVQKQLEKLIGVSSKVRTNVNADEAAVFGAVFQGAGLSPSFRVKEIRSVENAAYAVGVEWSAEGKDRRQKLFTPTSEVGAEKQVPFKKLDDFSFNLYQNIPSSSESEDPAQLPVVSIQTQNLTKSVSQLASQSGCSRANITTRFAIRISPSNGLPEVAGGTVSCEVEATEKKGVVDDVKGFFGLGSKKGDQEPLKEAEDESESSSLVEESASSASSSATETASPSSTAESDVGSKELKKRTESIPLSFSTKSQGLPEPSDAQLKLIKKRLSDFDASDTSRKLREEALNTLEGFVYRSRDLLSDDSFLGASTAAEQTKLETKLRDANEWLYGDGAEADRETLRARLDDLKSTVSPIDKRRKEAAKRPESIKALKEALAQSKMFIQTLKEQLANPDEEAAESSASIGSANSKPQTTVESSTAEDAFADLDDETTSTSTTTAPSNPTAATFKSMYSPEDLKEITSSSESIEDWLSTKMAEQDKLSPADDPVIATKDIEAKSKELENALMDLLQKSMRNMPKPKSSSSKSKAKSKKGKSKSKSSRSQTTTVSEAADAEETTEGAPKKSYIPMGDGENQPSDEQVEAGLKKVREMEQKVKNLRDGKVKLDEEQKRDEL